MEYKIREIRKEEIPLLRDFLYEAIFIPPWYTKKVPRDIIDTTPALTAAIYEFGEHPDDYCYVAEVREKVIGAVWVRTEKEYGYIDRETPSFSISLYPEYRNYGIGTALMEAMLHLLKEKGYQRASLGVSKENYALKMYEKLGFRIIGDGADNTEYLMVCDLKERETEN